MEEKCSGHDSQLISWLREALARESEQLLQLRFHLEIVEKPGYRARLAEHLTDTGRHAWELAGRIEQLQGPAGKTIAARARAARASTTPRTASIAVRSPEQVDLELRTVRVQLREQQVQASLYRAIEAFAETVGDEVTAELAACIRDVDEQMATYLSAELIRMVCELAEAGTVSQRSGRTQTRSRAAAMEPALERTRRLRAVSAGPTSATAQMRSI
ncbi:MAG: DUF892 family protein [Solirubrobacteraceae bacterium]